MNGKGPKSYKFRLLSPRNSSQQHCPKQSILQIPLPKLLEFFTADPQQDLEQLLYLALLLETRFWGPKIFRTELLLKDS
jgi:hypothetical protein